jgi:hypothetical protein
MSHYMKINSLCKRVDVAGYGLCPNELWTNPGLSLSFVPFMQYAG